MLLERFKIDDLTAFQRSKIRGNLTYYVQISLFFCKKQKQCDLYTTSIAKYLD